MKSSEAFQYLNCIWVLDYFLIQEIGIARLGVRRLAGLEFLAELSLVLE